MKKLILTVLTLSFTIILSAQEKVNFTENFKNENQGKYSIEVNEVKELLIIMLAITDYGLGNDDMFEQKGDYYQRVLTHFEPYKNEPIILKMDSLMKASPLEYIFFSGNAQTYTFNKDTLAPSDVFLFPAQGVGGGEKREQNPITTYKKVIEDFAIKTGFRDFYKSEKPFYDNIISKYKKYSDIQKQWAWLEQNFEKKIDSYIIYTSALINGLNYTSGYKNNDFQLIEMVLPAIDKRENMSEEASEAFNTRSMFTEIDHNYVDEASKKYGKELNEALKDREKWVTNSYGTKYYIKGENVFNEYMTYGVFILYIEDIYKDEPELLNEINNEVVKVMNGRGFIKMNEFKEELKSLRKKHNNSKIEVLYPELVEWCANE